MSQPKLTLRPPPNVDFVQGYPGIPPGGADRPQAAVKGAIEVRVGQQGVKAKWVRIELRKIETLPGGGVANTFFDFVGQSPINLWQSPNDEYSTLHTNDFPFFIRIPESIPPTIALEKGAGIKYELIASVCVQGKKGFLRRDKPTITATASTIIIDKHELHSTWPIYSQPETRNHSQDGVTLLIERSHTCYGPGDRVVVMATVKADSLHTVMLRGFEFMLRETTIFRAAPHTQGKKGSPQVKVSSIGEQKVPVNVTLYGGTQHKAELSVTVPPHHTSATINAARHIDINYVLTVKALMGTGQPVIMDLPVMISNWPRAVSVEAMRRIGHAFNVSLPGQPSNPGAPSAAQQHFAPSLMGKTASSAVSPTSASGSSHGYSNSIDKKASVSDIRSAAKAVTNQFSTAPPNSEKTNYGVASEFGERKKSIDISTPAYATQTIGATNYTTPVATASRTRASSGASSDIQGVVPIGRPRSSGGRANSAIQRLTIVNASEEEMREHKEAEAERARRHPSTILESPISLTPPPGGMASRSVSASASKPAASGSRRDWLSAEQEKELLYKNAIAAVERTHATRSPGAGSESAPSETPAIVSPTPVTPASSKTQRQWPTAEEEKAREARLFNEAQAAVARARGLDTSTSSSSGNAAGSSSSYAPQAGGSSSAGASGSGSGSGSGSASARAPSAAAALYSEAMSAINKPVASPAPSRSPITPATTTPTSALPSAADEKAMLQRYFEAKHAVFQTQSAFHGRVPGNAGPVPYDALYPNQQPLSPPPSNPFPSPAVVSPRVDNPPSFAASGSSHPILSELSEKERMRRHYEAQDAAAQQPQQPWQPAPPTTEYPASPSPQAYPATPAMADPRFSSIAPPPVSGNPPPFTPSPAKQLSAFDEKEMLRRKYEQQDATATGSPKPTPTPPPRASQMLNGSGARGRPPPTPPVSPGTPGTPYNSRPLTAAEEKARLRAMYESDDRGMLQTPASAQSPYPSPPPSNGYHEHDLAPRKTPSPQIPPPPPPLAPKPPREYIEETKAEDLRTSARLQAIDAVDPTNVLASLKQADPEFETIESDEEEDDNVTMDHTFGPGQLSTLASGSAAGHVSVSLSRQPSLAMSASGIPLSVPPPPPLPPKLTAE